jgi:hypothetical protein
MKKSSCKNVDAEGAKRIAQRVGVDWNKELFTPQDFKRGIKVEMEHSSCAAEGGKKTTSVIGTSHTKAGKIALAHLREDFRYYDPKVGILAFEKKLKSTRKEATAKRKKELSKK